jgi:NAD+ synthase (glutamine-hydrolysing)
LVGDIVGNTKKILGAIKYAKSEGVALVVLPELALTGYPPEDLLLNSGFIDANLKALDRIASKVRGIVAVVGFVDRVTVNHKEEIYNGAAVLSAGRVAARYHKMFLPNYGVFDEQRYFLPGTEALNVTIGDVTIGIGICEDIWSPDGPLRSQVTEGADLIVNLNASPYHIGKETLREEILATRAIDNRVVVAYVNTVGGQDELVFDGRSLIIASNGKVLRRGAAFEEQVIVEELTFEFALLARLHAPVVLGAEQSTGLCRVREITIKGKSQKRAKGTKKVKSKKTAREKSPKRLGIHEEVYSALILGTRDYVRKNGFTRVVIGLSGGIDSALVAVIAAEALGPENITVLFMPSRYTARASYVDARKLAANLGVEYIESSIEKTFTDYLEMLKPMLKGRKPDVTEENLQARIRGNIIMALSNKFNWLVLTTGNKSEMSVGYATLYGDMAGGFAVIKDLPKLLVYKLSGWINRRAKRKLIPSRIITRPPSAELRADQEDSDTLPPYEVLDPILKAYVEEDRSVEEIAALGFDSKVVGRIIRMVDISEYKRRQAPPGVKITPRALGKDRRMPITNGYSGGMSLVKQGKPNNIGRATKKTRKSR